MRITVTGGAGFIGSHVVHMLLGRGDEVQVLDDLRRGARRNLKDAAKLERVDICTPAAVQAIHRFAPHAVVHLAAQMDVAASLRDPLHDAHVNVLGTINVVQASVAAGAKILVGASTGGTIYGDAATLPTPETTPCAPRCPYAASKQCGEVYLNLAARTQGLRTVSLRLGNVYGPRQSRAGEAGVVAIFAEEMLAGAPITIYGDGRQSRDFIYVEDVARAFVDCIDSPNASGAYNVGTGVGRSMLQVVGGVTAQVGCDDDATHAPGKAGEVRHSALCSARLLRATGWKAEVSFEEGLRRTVQALRAASESRRPFVGRDRGGAVEHGVAGG